MEQDVCASRSLDKYDFTDFILLSSVTRSQIDVLWVKFCHFYAWEVFTCQKLILLPKSENQTKK